jgi:arylsulfatase I/J
MATPMHSPRARGYDTWLGYWHHANDYWSFDQDACSGKPIRDLWRQNVTFDGPAADLVNGPSCTDRNQTPAAGERCVFEDSLLTSEVLRILREHTAASSATDAAESPFFIFWAPHLVHMPLQIPKAYLEQFSAILNQQRRRMHAMVKYLDGEVGTVVSALQRSGAWNRTLLVVRVQCCNAAVRCGLDTRPLPPRHFHQETGTQDEVQVTCADCSRCLAVSLFLVAARG